MKEFGDPKMAWGYGVSPVVLEDSVLFPWNHHTGPSYLIGLDPKSARLLKDLFKAFTQRGGTILMSTHTLEVAEDMCDRIGIIQAGKIVACGTMTELRHQFEAGDASLEDLFLRLTGGVSALELGHVLDR